MSTVVMPERIARLKRDKRGYPITFVTALFEDGTADFSTLDEDRVGYVLAEKLCGVCAEEHEDIKCAIATPDEKERGIFRDPPMHFECANYALEACPFLASHDMSYIPVEYKPTGIALLGPDFIPTEVTRVASTEQRIRQEYSLLKFRDYTFGRTAQRTWLWKGTD